MSQIFFVRYLIFCSLKKPEPIFIIFGTQKSWLLVAFISLHQTWH